MNSKFLFGLIAILGIIFILNPVNAERPDASAEWIMSGDLSTSTGGIRVVDSYVNADPNSIESLVVDVTVTTMVVGTYPFEDEYIQVTLTETGPNTGIFEGMVFITKTDESSGNTIHVADNKDRIEFEYTYSQVPGSDSPEDMLGIGGSIPIERLEFKSVIESTAPTHGKIKWLEASYPASGTGVVRVIDPDMNLDPEAVDNFFDVDVWSDTDFAGIDLTMTETGDATGVFEGTVFFTTTDESSGHRLRVSQGDTIYSKYDDTTIPKTNTNDKLALISTATIQGNSVSIIEDRITLDEKSYAWNDVVSITITAPELNLDTKSVEEIDDSEKFPIEITTRHFKIKEFNLVETGVDTGIFSGRITLSLDDFPSMAYDDDGVSVSFEYEEDMTAIGSAPIVLNSELLDFTDERCGVDTVSIDGVCQVVKVEKTKTVGDDAPFFGIFVYLDNLISWIFGNPPQSETINESEKMPITSRMTTDKSRMTFGEFLRVDVEIDSPVTAPHEIRVVGPDGKTYASIIAETDDKHGWSFQSKENWPRGTYEIQLLYFDEKAITSTTFILQKSKTDFDFVDIVPKSKNELQASPDLVLLGKTVTIFGNISNPETEYVVLRVFNENGDEMENSRKTLDDAGFYWHGIKIQSSWPVGTYSVTLVPSEFDSVVYFDVVGTEDTWGETNKEIQNFL